MYGFFYESGDGSSVGDAGRTVDTGGKSAAVAGGGQGGDRRGRTAARAQRRPPPPLSVCTEREMDHHPERRRRGITFPAVGDGLGNMLNVWRRPERV